MADILQRLTAGFPSARGELRTKWGSAGGPDFRLEIRRSIASTLKGDLGILEDLSVRPTLPEWNISVSHTSDLGGWVAVPRLYAVGFDIELRSRLKREIVERVSSPTEIAGAPDPVFLWVAKEACFKALGSMSGRAALTGAALAVTQPPTISAVTITGWAPQFSLWTYSSQTTRGRGWVASDETRIYGLFII